MKKAAVASAALLAVATLLTGCQKEEVEKLVAPIVADVQETPEATEVEEEKSPLIPEIDDTLSIEEGARIAVVSKSKKGEFWNKVKEGMEAAVKDVNEAYGFKKDKQITMTFEGPDDEEISPELFQNGGREKEQASDSRQDKPENNPRLITVAFHKHGYRDGKDEIGKPIGGFRERSLKSIQFASLHQLPYHGRKQVAAYRPQEEKAEDQSQRYRICILFHGMTVFFLFRHVFDIRKHGKFCKPVELPGIFSQEKALLAFRQLGRLHHKIVRHLISDSRNRTRIIRTPHQLFHSDQFRRLTNRPYRSLKRIELVIEKPGDSAGFNPDIGMARQTDLFFPTGTCHHAKMPDSNFQPGALLDNFLHLRDLRSSIRQIDGKHDAFLFHIAEHQIRSRSL